jgi:hypothetical protein
LKGGTGHNTVRFSTTPSQDSDAVTSSKAGTAPTPSKNIDTVAFKIVEEWNRGGKVPKILLEEDSTHGAFSFEALRIYKTVSTLKLYHLQNQIMDLFWHSSKDRPRRYIGLSTVAILNEAGITDTPLYTFALRGSVRALMEGRMKDEQWEADLEELDKDPRAMKDVLIYIRRWIKEGPWSKPGKDDICGYHVHPDGSRCGSDFGSTSGPPSNNDPGSDNELAGMPPPKPTVEAGDAS